MPFSKVCVWNIGDHDRTRWIGLGYRGATACILQLTDICAPGKVSRLTSVTIPTGYLKTSLVQGALQITLPTGHFLLQRDEDLVRVEFKGTEDAGVTRASFRAEEFTALLTHLETEAGNLALTR